MFAICILSTERSGDLKYFFLTLPPKKKIPWRLPPGGGGGGGGGGNKKKKKKKKKKTVTRKVFKRAMVPAPKEKN